VGDSRKCRSSVSKSGNMGKMGQFISKRTHWGKQRNGPARKKRPKAEKRKGIPNRRAIAVKRPVKFGKPVALKPEANQREMSK